MDSVLEKNDWQRRADDHLKLVSQWTEPFRNRRRLGKSHPIHDFLFIYYQYSSRKLEQWHPGISVGLDGINEFSESFSPSHYSIRENSLFCEPRKLNNKAINRLSWSVDLLKQTQARRPNYSCMGMHEWAMVYQGDEVRHEETTKFRLGQRQIDELVENQPIVCSHYDAFRFFAGNARGLNRLKPTLHGRSSLEQPACIHANMDLYKWAFKAMPWIGSELLLKCFKLAMEARIIDMRASPYYLGDYGEYEPIKIETPGGRTEYEMHQREIADKAAQFDHN